MQRNTLLLPTWRRAIWRRMAVAILADFLRSKANTIGLYQYNEKYFHEP